MSGIYSKISRLSLIHSSRILNRCFADRTCSLAVFLASFGIVRDKKQASIILRHDYHAYQSFHHLSIGKQQILCWRGSGLEEQGFAVVYADKKPLNGLLKVLKVK